MADADQRRPFMLLVCLGIVATLVILVTGGYYLSLRRTAPVRDGILRVTVTAQDGGEKDQYLPTDRPVATLRILDAADASGPVEASWFDAFGYRINSVHADSLAGLTQPISAGAGPLAAGSYVFLVGRVDSHGFVEVYGRVRIEVRA
jgi:hypothetical protein